MNIFNKKIILFFSITSLMMNGCVAKNEFKTKSASRVLLTDNQFKVKNNHRKASSWNTQKNTIKKEDCFDCYATPMKSSKPVLKSRNLLLKVMKKPVQPSFKETKVINDKYFGKYKYKETASDTMIQPKSITPRVSYVNTSHGSYATNIAIQVGAFRVYNGAKIYKKRYNALSNKYKVSIRTSRKNNRPLHRVRIEGFKNRNEAKMFMNTYGLTNAFLVRK